MAANEDEVRLRLTAETLGYRKAWADARVQTARDLAQIKATVTTSLNQTRINAAQSVAGIRQTVATNLAQTRVNTAQQLAQVRVNTAQQLNQIRNNAAGTLGQMGSQFETTGRRMTVGLTLPLVALAAASIKSAKSIDTQLNVLRAFAGGSEAAEKRLAQLNALALKTPGLTNNLAVTLDAQLRPLKVAEKTIDSILPALGRLNAVSPLGDAEKFARNLTQLVTQNFERRDLKELVGQSPVAGQIITELFNVDSPINSTAIRKAAQRMGIRTVDDFFAAFADAASRNKGLQNVTESIGTRFEKLSDRVSLALRPLGIAIINAFDPILDVAVPVIEALGRAFNALPAPIKTVTVGVGAFAAVIGPTVFIAGSLINTVLSLQKAYVALNALALIPTISNMRLLGQVMQGTASLSAGAAATMAVRFGALVAAILGAVAASVAIARATDGYLTSLQKTHPWVARFGQATLAALNPLYTLLKGLGLVGPETKKVGDAQAAAVGPVGDFTEAIEEESRTLKQLKRDLAEVEIATRDRVAAAQRAYNEGLTTLRESTATQAQALLDEQKRQLAIIDQGIKEAQEKLDALRGAKPQGLGAHGAGPSDAATKEEKTAQENLEKLLLERLQITSETNNKIRDLDSQRRIKERELEEQHGEALLSVQRVQAGRQIDLLRDVAEQNESLRLDSERKIVAIERRLTDAEIAAVRQRIDVATQGTEARTRLEDELAQKLAERGRQRAEQARRIARAELDAALLPLRRKALQEGAQGAGDEGTIARLRDQSERGALSAAQAEQRIENILDEGFARRIRRLKDEIAARKQFGEDVSELNAQLAQVEQERTNSAEEGERRVRDGMERDAERRRELTQDALNNARTVATAQLAVREALLRGIRVTFGREAELINRRYDLENERLTLAGNEAQDELREREQDELISWRERLTNEEAFERKKLEIQGRYDELRKLEADKTSAEIDALEQDRQRELERQNPLSARSLFGDRYADISDAFGPVAAALDSIKTHALDAFAQMGEAFGSMVEQWVLTGELGAGGVRSFVASALGSLAKMFFVQSLAELAYGFAALTPWGAAIYGPAPLHFKAAALLGAASVAAAVVGRAVAGNGGKSQGATASAAVGNGGGGEAQPGNREFTFGVGSTPASDDARGRGLMGTVLAPVLDYIKSAREEDRMRTALIVQSNDRVAGALGTLETASPDDVVMKGADGARAAVASAVLDHSGSDAGWTDELARNLRVT